MSLCMKGHGSTERCPNQKRHELDVWCPEHAKSMSPGQKLDETIAVDRRRGARMLTLIHGLDRDDLKALYGVVHVKLFGDGEDD